MKIENVRTFKRMLERHPEGLSHSEVHNFWPGGGKHRPKTAEVRDIVRFLFDEGTISITEVPRARGKAATLYQLVKYAASGVKAPGSPQRHSIDFKNSIRDFLNGRGRTLRQIVTKFGKNAESCLKDDFDGFSLFNQVNARNEQSFILLSKPTIPIQVTEKDWNFHIGVDKKGRKQPYLLVQLPDSAFQEGRNFGRAIRIAPLFDAHFGHKTHREDKFRHYLKWIEETPGLYAILGEI